MAITISSNIMGLRVKEGVYPAFYVFNSPYKEGDCPLFGGTFQEYSPIGDGIFYWNDSSKAVTAMLSIEYRTEDALYISDRDEYYLKENQTYEIKFFNSCKELEDM